MWTLTFNVSCEINLNDRKIPNRRNFNVSAERMFQVIKTGSFEFNGCIFMLEEGEEGRSPKHGVRIFDKVILIH